MLKQIRQVFFIMWYALQKTTWPSFIKEAEINKKRTTLTGA